MIAVEPGQPSSSVRSADPARRGAPGRRKRIVVIHLCQEWVGGGEAVALASIEALERDYDVTLVGVTRPDLDRLNALFGTELAWSDVAWRPVPPAPALERLLPDPSGLLRHLAHPLRFCRSLAQEYDLSISTFNDMDLGMAGIQYCHHPGMAMAFQPDVVRRVIDRDQALPPFFASRCKLHRVLALLTGYRERRVRRNLTLANSGWTARVMEQAYGGPVEVIYPPVGDVPAGLPWHEREHGFVCIGRLVPSKRVGFMIRVLERVRRQGYPVHLHIVTSHAQPAHLDELAPLLRSCAAWVTLDWNLSRAELLNLLGRHRYGIHGMENEHFGIAVAEMAKAGMIPFVPDSGGQVEIVADERLTYASLEDAATKVGRVLGEPSLQRELRAHLEGQAQRFSRARFASALQALVARRLGGPAVGA